MNSCLREEFFNFFYKCTLNFVLFLKALNKILKNSKYFNFKLNSLFNVNYKCSHHGIHAKGDNLYLLIIPSEFVFIILVSSGDI